MVFWVIGPPLVARLGPASTIALAAGAGVVRWVAMGSTTSILALALVQPLHGLTFAALHLACMRLITAIAPSPLAATAQALYALGAGATTALLTLGAGRLYGSLGAQGFFVVGDARRHGSAVNAWTALRGSPHAGQRRGSRSTVERYQSGRHKL